MKLTLHSATTILENKLLDRPTDILTTSLTDGFKTQLYGLWRTCGCWVGGRYRDTRVDTLWITIDYLSNRGG